MEAEMVTRVEWLRLQWQHGSRERLPLALTVLLAFEAYYQLCALLGYRPRHALLDASPESLRAIPPGVGVMMVWPRLPPPIRVMERVWPYAYGTLAELVPYTPEAESAARAAGKRTQVLKTVRGELRSGGSIR
jgi:hypothetical protein